MSETPHETQQDAPAATQVPNNLPAGYHNIQPYLIYQDAVAAIAWYSQVYGATERLRMNDQGRITHAELQIGDSVIMMADEHPDIQAFAAPHFGGSPVSIMVYVENCDATYKQALDAGATGIREPADQPYGDRMSGIIDPFGYKWFIAHPLPISSTDDAPNKETSE